MKFLLRHAFHPQIVKRAFQVAFVVGTVLNVINHYDLLLGIHPGMQTVIQVGLTYLVPYLVSTHGQVFGFVQQPRND